MTDPAHETGGLRSRQGNAANGLDLRAVGWVVTRDLCFEILLDAIGAAHRIEPLASRSLLESWRVVARAYAREARPLVSYAGHAVSLPLSRETDEALRAFARDMAIRCPARYDIPALRRRCLAGLGQALGAVLAASIGAAATSPGGPIGAEIGALAAFAVWRLLTTLQLYRTLRIVTFSMKH